VIVPPWWLYFTALEIRFTMTCDRRCRSAQTARAGEAQGAGPLPLLAVAQRQACGRGDEQGEQRDGNDDVRQ
jgi:hypothetical protein